MDSFYDELAEALANRQEMIGLLEAHMELAAMFDGEAHRFGLDPAAMPALIRSRDIHHDAAGSFVEGVAISEAAIDELLTERAGRQGLLLVLV